MRLVYFSAICAALSCPVAADPLAPLPELPAPVSSDVEKPERVIAYERERLDHRQVIAEYRRRQAEFVRRLAETRARSDDVRAALNRNAQEQERYRRQVAANQAVIEQYRRARQAYERCVAGELSSCPVDETAKRRR